MAIYTTALFALTIGLVGAGVFSLRLSPANLERYEPIPRNRIAGGVLAFIALLWCIPHTRPIIWTSWVPLLYPLAIFCTVLAIVYLDNLFSRALGGFMILAAYYFLHGSFTWHSTGVVIFSLLCWGFGIVGIFFSGKPYLMRDLMRKCAASPGWRFATAVYCFIFALSALIAGIAHLT
jgi:hypothetical protein